MLPSSGFSFFNISNSFAEKKTVKFSEDDEICDKSTFSTISVRFDFLRCNYKNNGPRYLILGFSICLSI